MKKSTSNSLILIYVIKVATMNNIQKILAVSRCLLKSY